MSPAAASPAEMIAALDVRGQWPEYADKLVRFGQFVGAWDIDITQMRRRGPAAF
jgi:hypothetical protein